jgi:hypothetical protein
MANYVLKLYSRISPRSPDERRLGEYQFDAPHDIAAILAAKARYGDEMANYGYVRLTHERGRFVWEQGSSTRA